VLTSAEKEAGMLEPAQSVRTKIEYVLIRDVVARTQIYYDPDPRHCVIEEDAGWCDPFTDSCAV
jgi:hypothetical protein